MVSFLQWVSHFLPWLHWFCWNNLRQFEYQCQCWHNHLTLNQDLNSKAYINHSSPSFESLSLCPGQVYKGIMTKLFSHLLHPFTNLFEKAFYILGFLVLEHGSVHLSFKFLLSPSLIFDLVFETLRWRCFSSYKSKFFWKC